MVFYFLKGNLGFELVGKSINKLRKSHKTVEHQENTLLWRFVYIKVWSLTSKTSEKMQMKEEWSRTLDIPRANIVSVYILLELYFCVFIFPTSLVRTLLEPSSCNISNTEKPCKRYKELSNTRHRKDWEFYLGNLRGSVVCWYCFGCQENPTEGIYASKSNIDYFSNFVQIIFSGGDLPFSLPHSFIPATLFPGICFK